MCDSPQKKNRQQLEDDEDTSVEDEIEPIDLELVAKIQKEKEKEKKKAMEASSTGTQRSGLSSRASLGILTTATQMQHVRKKS